MRSTRLEVVAHTLQGLGMCTGCELMLSEAGLGPHPSQRTLDEYPEDWQEEYRRLADWILDLANVHRDEILIKVIDPQSFEGLLKSLRYRIRRYPTWIVDGEVRMVGWDRPALDAALQRS